MVLHVVVLSHLRVNFANGTQGLGTQNIIAFSHVVIRTAVRLRASTHCHTRLWTVTVRLETRLVCYPRKRVLTDNNRLSNDSAIRQGNFPLERALRGRICSLSSCPDT